LTVLSETFFSEMNEKTIEGTLYREARIEGAEDFRVMISKPKRDQGTFSPLEEGTLLSGETVVLYLAVEFERYWSEAIRTLIVKDNVLVPVERQDLNERYKKIMGLLEPGKAASQFCKEAFAQIRKEKAELLPAYGLGQGIGLSPRESPTLSKDDKTPLKEGMCLTVRLLVKEEALGAVMTGNTLLLTRKGPEILT
jgi:Xaa-Pro aminopeptidase